MDGLCSKQSSGILRRVLLVRTDVSEEHIASIFRVGGKEARTDAGFLWYCVCENGKVKGRHCTFKLEGLLCYLVSACVTL
jgi:hypothetical protein